MTSLTLPSEFGGGEVWFMERHSYVRMCRPSPRSEIFSGSDGRYMRSSKCVPCFNLSFDSVSHMNNIMLAVNFFCKPEIHPSLCVQKVPYWHHTKWGVWRCCRMEVESAFQHLLHRWMFLSTTWDNFQQWWFLMVNQLHSIFWRQNRAHWWRPRVCGVQNRHFKPHHVVFLTPSRVAFVPEPSRSIKQSTVTGEP